MCCRITGDRSDQAHAFQMLYMYAEDRIEVASFSATSEGQNHTLKTIQVRGFGAQEAEDFHGKPVQHMGVSRQGIENEKFLLPFPLKELSIAGAMPAYLLFGCHYLGYTPLTDVSRCLQVSFDSLNSLWLNNYTNEMAQDVVSGLPMGEELEPLTLPN